MAAAAQAPVTLDVCGSDDTDELTDLNSNAFNDFNVSTDSTNDSLVLSYNRFSILNHCDDGSRGPDVVITDTVTDTATSVQHVSCNSYNHFNHLKYKLNVVQGFAIGHINVRSILPKIDQVRYILDTCKFDILCVNESWLDDNILVHEYEVNDYKTIVNHRNRHGGGIVMYVKNHILFKRRLDLEIDSLECVWIELMCNKKSTLICSMYRPPSMGADYYDKMLASIEKACLEDKFTVIAGDLNFNYVFDESLHSNPLHFIESANGLAQLVDKCTRVTPNTSSLIDVIFTSHPNLHHSTGVFDIALSDHYLVYTIVKISNSNVTNKQVHNEVIYRNFKNFDVHKFITDVQSSAVLDSVMDIADVELAWSTWKREYITICDKHAPLCKSRMKNRYNPWINNEIVKLMYRRDFLHKEMVRNPDEDIVNEFKAVRLEVNLKIKKAKCDYFDTLYKEGKGNSKTFWSELRKLSGKSKCNATCDISAEQFNEHFCNIGTTVTSHFPPSQELLWKGPSSIHDFKFRNVPEESVLKLLKGLSLSSSIDLLTLDCKLLRLSSHLIVKQLTYMYNLTFSHGVIPSDWKVARVTPIYKNSGDVNVATNYRPISVIGFIAKVLEKDVQCQFMSYLIENHFITLDQSAYKKFHSTSTCLHTTIDEWLQNMDDKLFTGICYLDIAKCFDTISHDLLLQKLTKYGVHNVELQWFKSYLSDRSQFVTYNNKSSNYCNLTLGVPQGSTLGPMLFMLFVNDLPMYINNGRCAMYADDTVVYVSSDTVAGASQNLNDVLNNVHNWFTSNRLVLNVSKSNAMLIGNGSAAENHNNFDVLLDNSPLHTVQCTKYLGVNVDDQLKFDQHIHELVRKLNSKLSWLCRLRHSVPRHVLEITFKSYVQPIFDYACTIWGCSKANVDAIQCLQNRAARIICSNFIL
jgi:hypothetical protein